MAQYDGYVRIKTEIASDEANRKLASLANNLNRQLMALEKQRDKVDNLVNGYNRLAEAGKRFDEAAESGASESHLSGIADEISTIMKELGFSQKTIEETMGQLGTVDFAETSAMQGLADNIERARSAQQGLEANVENTRAAFEAERNAAGSVAPNIHSASSAVERFNKRIGRMAKTAFVFYAFRRAFTFIRQSIVAMSGLSAVTSVFSDFNEKMKTAYTQNKELQSALASLRGALYTAFNPIMETVIPLLVRLANWLARVISYIGAFFAALNGKKLSDNAAAAQNLAKSVGGVGSAAKSANKQLAAFDKLNNLSEDTASGGGGGGGASDHVSFDTELDEGKTNKIVEAGEKIRAAFDKVKTTIQQLNDYWDKASLGDKFALLAGQLIALFTVIGLFVGLPAAIMAAVALLALFLIQNWDEIKAWWEESVVPFFDDLSLGVETFFDGIIGKIQKFLEDGVKEMRDCKNPFADVFMVIFETILNIVIIAVVAIKTVVLTVVDFFRAVVKTIAAIGNGDWRGAWEAWKKVFSDVWNGLDGIITPVINIVCSIIENFLNVIIDSLNGVISAFDWVASAFGKDIGFRINRVTLPRYAEGGFPSIGSMFIAGEAGPELVGSFGSHNNSVINEAQLVQAFQSATAEQVTLLRQQNALLQGILEKSGVFTFSPSAAAGKVFSQSIGMYNRAMG